METYREYYTLSNIFNEYTVEISTLVNQVSLFRLFYINGMDNP